MLLISFIIPLYNAKGYIERCLRSIFFQNLASDTFEVIVVNDGSTDGSLQITESLKAELPNLLIINQKNQGVSVARNEGLKLAKGKYIYFVDADDFLKSDSLKNIMEVAERFKNIDSIGFSLNIIKDGHTRKLKRGETLKEPISGIEWARHYVKELYYTPSIIFKRESILKNRLWFNPRVTVWEDILFLTQFFCLSKNVHYLDKVLYNYTLYPDSLSHKRAFKTPQNRFFILLSLIQFYFTRNLDKTQRKYLRNRISLWFVLLTDTLTRYVFTKWLTRARDRINARV